RMHLTEDTYQNPKEPPMFCMVLRKHLSGAILEEVEQIGMERIVLFKFRARNVIGDISYKTLIMEIMCRHSNLILVNPDNNKTIESIKHAAMSQNRYRTMLPGAEHTIPPQYEKLNPLKLDYELLTKRLVFNTGKMYQQLVNFPTRVPPFMANELVHRAG